MKALLSTLALWGLATLVAVNLSSCSSDSNSTSKPRTSIENDSESSLMLLPPVDESKRTVLTNEKLLNAEASVPPQCYTKTEGKHNPCFTCHQLYDRRNGEDRLNQLDDGSLQGGYMFSDVGVTNHWSNLFVDRTQWLDEVSDENIIEYINQENYSDLARGLAQQGWQGFVPDLDNYHMGAEAFDEKGLAKDGTHWVAFNYKPFPGTFWPTNGSTDDVVIRLAKPYRELNGEFNADIYFINLSLVEMNIKNINEVSIWEINEQALDLDVDKDGQLSTANKVVKNSHFYGDASNIELSFQQFPKDTEFMHTVRYVGLSDADEIVLPPRMKELRYMKKVNVLKRYDLNNRYAMERKNKILGKLPSFIDHGDGGFDNGLGWFIQAFIEDYEGSLRPQTFEERLFCMGCHSAVGTTIDSTFSLARKVTGTRGWKYIDLQGMVDAPAFNETDGEIINYLKRAGGGSEFRENPEMVSKWYNADGSLNEERVRAADVYTILAPSRRRALDLNKAYTHIVRHQSFIYGRDATWHAVNNVFKEIDENIPPLESSSRYFHWDISLRWPE